MSAPVVAQVDSISGDAAEAEPFFYGQPEPGIFSMTFSRTYQHYVQNNMQATGYAETLGGGGILNGWDLDEGWHMVPYWNPGVSMSAGDLAKIAAMGDGIRIDSLGYKIKLAQPFRSDITAITGVTEISNTFTHEPVWETYVDGDHTFEGMPEPLTTPINTAMTIGYTPVYPNNNMKSQEATSFATAELPRVKWHWHRNGLAPHTGWSPDDTFPRKGSGDGPFDVMSTLAHSGRQCHGSDAMTGYGVTWNNKDQGAWYPFCVPQGDKSIWPNINQRNITWPGTFPLRRDNLLNGTAGLDSESGGANVRGTNLPNSKHNRWQKASWDTALPFGANDLPPDSFIKLQRLHDISSPIRLAGMVIIEYTCRVSVSPSSKIYMGIPFTTSGSGTSYENKGANNQWTQGTLRQWRMWGIPNLPIPTTGSSIISGTIRFPPWQIFNQWQTVSGGVTAIRPPIAGFVEDWPPGDDHTNGLFYRPDLELATLTYTDGSGNIFETFDTLFCLVQNWDGDPPTAPDQATDAETKNGFMRPALTSYATVSGIPQFVWVMEAIATDVFSSGVGTDLSIQANPIRWCIGPPAPASNVVHLFADPEPPAQLAVCSPARKRRYSEMEEEELGL